MPTLIVWCGVFTSCIAIFSSVQNVGINVVIVFLILLDHGTIKNKDGLPTAEVCFQ